MILARFFATWLFLLLAMGKAEAEGAPELHIMAEELSPYAFLEGVQIKGLSVDLLVEMLDRAGLPYTRKDITIVPWARGYAQVQSRPNTLLFSTVRSPDREDQFQWVGPIIDTRTVIWGRRDRGIAFTDAAGLKNYRIAVSRNSVGHEWLLSNGVPEEAIVPIVRESRGAILLDRGRVDLWVADETMARWEIRRSNLRPSAFQIVHTLMGEALYYAAHKDSDKATISALQEALDQMKSDGTYHRIMARYLQSGPHP
ncbi:MAG: ABC transporter substrate-binding protein [Alphaproteobacteria bacterium]|nr:ABC transporter substrate-binding protein [Alphaproteobacteria bacterium]